ncbi:MAG: tetratricopeptide repeat protein [Kiritimatiellae bacterium]|nr:tetratricopeptide repeat protein [Kiritimatiellia bacterium]
MNNGASNPASGLRRVLLAALLLPALAGALSAALEPGRVQMLFHEANSLFRQANERVRRNPDEAKELYRRAALRFERIANEGGIENGRLYYNIGNAYFRMEDLGRAVLYYRRAQQYIPNDINLQQNLQYARDKRLDKIDEKQRTRVLKTLFFWHYDFSARARSVLFAVFFLAVWGGAALRLFFRRGWLNWTLALAAIAAALFMASLLVETAALRNERPGVVISPQVVARKGDSETYEKSFTEPLHAGTEFTLVEQRADWYHVQLADGRRCWVPAKSAELVR